MDHDTQIEDASERLHAAVAEAVQCVGVDIATALLIHYLHEVSLQKEAGRAA